MKISKRSRTVLALLLVVTGTILYCPTAEAQYTVTTLSNRVLKKTYMQVANAGNSTPGVFCSPSGCVNQLSPFPNLSVSCPGTGTCTFEFDVCARIAPKTSQFDDNYFHTIRIDGAALSPGPGDITMAIPPGAPPDQQNYCATSAVGSGISAGVHTVSMTLGAQDLTGNGVHADIPNVVFKVRVHKP